jgi:hypothetical protein
MSPRGRDAGARQPERRHAQVAEDEDPVEDDVEDVGGQNHPERRSHLLAALEVLAQRAVDQEEGNARDLHQRVVVGHARQLRLLTREQQEALRLCPEQRDGEREQQRHGDAALERPSGPRAVAGAVGLGHDRVEAHQDAGREHRRPEDPDVRERRRGDRLDGHATHQHRVHEAEQHRR